MKKVAVIGPDIIFSNKYSDLTPASKRAVSLARYLAELPDLEVDLLLPSQSNAKVFDLAKYSVNLYSFSAAYFEWSEELDKKLLNYDFVIIQTVAGVGFQNCTVLPRTVNVIVDAWQPMVTQLPVELLSKNKIQRKLLWTKFLKQYQNLLLRANCVLCASSKQKSFYEGQFFMIEKLGWDAFKFSPMHVVPFGIDIDSTFSGSRTATEPLKLMWYGDFYHFSIIEELCKTISSLKNVTLDIYYNTGNSNFSRNQYSVKNLMGSLAERGQIKLVPFVEPIDYTQYNAGICIGNSWLEDEYSSNIYILEMLAAGLPVITRNTKDSFEVYDFLLNKGVYHVSDISELPDLLETVKLTYSEKNHKNLVEALNWEKVLSPIIDYIRKF